MLNAVVSLIEKADDTYGEGTPHPDDGSAPHREGREQVGNGNGQGDVEATNNDTSDTVAVAIGGGGMGSNDDVSGHPSVNSSHTVHVSGVERVMDGDGVTPTRQVLMTSATPPPRSPSATVITSPPLQASENPLLDDGQQPQALVDSSILSTPPLQPQGIGEIPALKELSAKCARLEIQLMSKEREVSLMQENLDREKQLGRDKNEAIAKLTKLCEKLRMHRTKGVSAAGEEKQADDHYDDEDVKHEMDAVVQDIYREPVTHLETVVKYHSQTIAALEHSNQTLRQQLTADEVRHEADLMALRTELEQSSFDSDRFSALLRESDKRKDETARLVKKLSTLQELSAQTSAELKTNQEQVETLHRVLAAKETELETMRESASQVRQIEQTAVFHSLEGKWYGQGVQRAMSFVDFVSMKSDSILRGNAVLRVFIALYLFFLHFYVFHVVTSVVHLMPQNVGETAQEHIDHHLHHK